MARTTSRGGPRSTDGYGAAPSWGRSCRMVLLASERFGRPSGSDVEDDLEEGSVRARHLPDLRHARDRQVRVGRADPDPRAGLPHCGQGHRSGQTRQAQREAEVRRLRPLQGRHAHRDHRGQGQQPGGWRRNAAGARLRGDDRRPVRVLHERRWFPLSRPHRALGPARD